MKRQKKNDDFYLVSLGNALRERYKEDNEIEDDDYAFSESDYILIRKDMEIVLTEMLEGKRTIDGLDKKSLKEKIELIGISVSESTIEKIIQFEYFIPARGDGRVKATLDKVTLYLGVAGWQSFIEIKKPLFEGQETDVIKKFLEEALLKTLACFIEGRFDDDGMSMYYNNKTQTYKTVKSLTKMFNQLHTWVYKSDNPLFSVQEIRIDKRTAHVYTFEFYNILISRNEIPEKARNTRRTYTHDYILEKMNNRWRINKKTGLTPILTDFIQVAAQTMEKNY